MCFLSLFIYVCVHVFAKERERESSAVFGLHGLSQRNRFPYYLYCLCYFSLLCFPSLHLTPTKYFPIFFQRTSSPVYTLVAPELSRRLPIMTASLRSQIWECGNFGGHSATGACFLEHFGFPWQFLLHQLLHIH
jgi:hypothetical protein